MKSFKSFLKKYWLAMWLILSVTAVLTMYVSAEYIRDQNREKRVVANMGDTGKRFASDRLTAITTPQAYEIPFSTTGNDPCEIDFKLYNYSLKDINKIYQSPIYYRIDASLVDKDGNAISDSLFQDSAFGIKKGTDSYQFFTSATRVISIDGSFSGTAQEDPHSFSIQFPRTMTTASQSNKVYIQVEATPYSDSARSVRITELDVLKAKLSVTAQSSKEITQGWTGKFQDSTFSDLDGFTFVFSGSGTAKLAFSYDKTKFEVNKYFLEDHETDLLFTVENDCYYSLDDGVWTRHSDSDWCTFFIDADSEVVSRYDIQLYMNSGNASLYIQNGSIDWNLINSYVRYNPNVPVN